jgi:tRNA pseudouridine55 synthase
MNGVLVVDKPKSLTSHDVVVRVRRQLGVRRVGHIGTLDPMATGVLPIVVGRATRLATLLSGGSKVYDAVIRLGIATDTYDVTGTIVNSVSPSKSILPSINHEMVERVKLSFMGTINQIPPPYSAKKIDGVRAYKLARSQRPVKMKSAIVTVYKFEIYKFENTHLHCRVICSPGFYMRSLANDLGVTLGCGGCLESLRRERNGEFGLEEAQSINTIERKGKATNELLIPLEKILSGLPSVIVTENGARRAIHGNVLRETDFATNTIEPQISNSPSESEMQSDQKLPHKIRVLNSEGNLIAIAEPGEAKLLHPRIVLV